MAKQAPTVKWLRCAAQRRGVPSACKSRPSKGRCDREDIPAAVEAMKLPGPGRQLAACDSIANAVFCEFASDELESAL